MGTKIGSLHLCIEAALWAVGRKRFALRFTLFPSGVYEHHVDSMPRFDPRGISCFSPTRGDMFGRLLIGPVFMFMFERLADVPLTRNVRFTP